MTRLAPLLAALALALPACKGDSSKDSPAPAASATESGDTAKATSAKPAADKPAADKPAADKVDEPERVRPTGVLDLEHVTKGATHIIRNPTFEVTFPTRPMVQKQDDRTPDGETITSGMAIATLRGTEQLGIVVMPIPKHLTYDPKTGIDGARDGVVRNTGAKITKETDGTLGGLPSRKVSATARTGGQTVYLEMNFAWDEAHHQLLMVMMTSPKAAPSKVATDFESSFKVKAS